MNSLWDGQQSTVHGPRHIFLNFKHLIFLSLVKKQITELIGRGGKDVTPPSKGG
jgi:hypothetical protein